MKIISGSSNPHLAKTIAAKLQLELLNTNVSRFNDGELKVQIEGTINNDVVIIQSTSTPVNDHLMELLLIADATKRAGAKNIIAVIPYFGYSRQDRCTYKNGPISSSLVIKMIELSGINHVITLDLHSSQLEGVFSIPITNLSTESIFFSIGQNKHNTIIVSPDIGGITRARNYSSLFGMDLAIINKSRDINNHCMMSQIIGNISGKNCIIVDDIVDGANTLCMASSLLLNNGAKSVEAIITHAVLSSGSVKNILSSKIKKVHITDSILHKNLPDMFNTLPSDELIVESLKKHVINLFCS